MEITLMIALAILTVVIVGKILLKVSKRSEREDAWLDEMVNAYEDGYGEFSIWLSHQAVKRPHLVQKYQGAIVKAILNMKDYAFKLQAAQVICQSLDYRHVEQLVSEIIREYSQYGEYYYDGASNLIARILHSPMLSLEEKKAYGRLIQTLSDAYLRRKSGQIITGR